MHGDLLLIILLLIVGCAAFFFGIIYWMCGLFAWVGRGLFGVVRPGSAVNRGRALPRRRPTACPNERCKKAEHRQGRFCSQCGTKLTETV